MCPFSFFSALYFQLPDSEIHAALLVLESISGEDPPDGRPFSMYSRVKLSKNFRLWLFLIRQKSTWDQLRDAARRRAICAGSRIWCLASGCSSTDSKILLSDATPPILLTKQPSTLPQQPQLHTGDGKSSMRQRILTPHLHVTAGTGNRTQIEGGSHDDSPRGEYHKPTCYHYTIPAF